jgi:hypothetical protein
MDDDFLPPPPKAKAENHPLSNADFRKLFETPRRGDGGDVGEGRHGGGKGRGDGFKKKKSRPKPEEPKKEEDASGYRSSTGTSFQFILSWCTNLGGSTLKRECVHTSLSPTKMYDCMQRTGRVGELGASRDPCQVVETRIT